MQSRIDFVLPTRDRPSVRPSICPSSRRRRRPAWNLAGSGTVPARRVPGLQTAVRGRTTPERRHVRRGDGPRAGRTLRASVCLSATKYDTIRGALNGSVYRTDTATKQWKTEKLKGKERICSEVSANSPGSPGGESDLKKKRKATVGNICRKGMFLACDEKE